MPGEDTMEAANTPNTLSSPPTTTTLESGSLSAVAATATASAETKTKTKSPQRQTADAIIDAFNRMDVDGILAPRSPSAIRHIFPKSTGHPPQDNARYTSELHTISGIFSKFRLIVHDVFEDEAARKVCYHVSTDAESVAGPYLNEYMWVFVFDESGRQVVESREFVDSKFSMEFLPKLRAAIRGSKDEAAAAT